jgi:hypothetical protein
MIGDKVSAFEIRFAEIELLECTSDFRPSKTAVWQPLPDVSLIETALTEKPVYGELGGDVVRLLLNWNGNFCA